MLRANQTPIEIVGLIGDVHAQDATLHVALDFLMAQPRMDRVLCTGDILGGEGSAERCCELLQEANVRTVRGNHERWHFETEPFVAEITALAQPEDLATWPLRLNANARNYLASLPPTLTFDTPYGELLLCHGLGEDDMAGVFPDESEEAAQERLAQGGLDTLRCRFVVNGHTHRSMVRQIGTTTIINAGTLLPHPEASCAILDLAASRVEFFRISQSMEVVRTQSYRLHTTE